MGRKPNALILQHFERGAKLNDSSNRYEHTCKACGEKFPKGRIDSLTTHLVKKCPAISIRDRQKALLELNNLPDLSDPARARNGEVQMNGPTVELPIGTSNWTALETLAEVSRQIDMNEKHDDRSVNNKSVGHGSRASEPPRADRLELQEQYTLDNPPVSYEQRVQRDKKVLHQKRPLSEDDAYLHPESLAFPAGSREASPTLATMAANSMAAAAAAARFVPSMVDPQLLGAAINGTHEDSMTAKVLEQELHEAVNLNQNYFHDPADPSSAYIMMDGTGGQMYHAEPDHSEHGIEPHTPETSSTPVNFPRTPAIMPHPMTTEFSAEYGNGQKTSKPKIRGRFSADRRKEVQEVRKKGACLRCRMLKKPCSGDTPCNTCKSVDSARLWKSNCIRTKIAEVIEMYSAGLHSVLAYHDVNRAKSQTSFRISPHSIEACHFPETGVFAIFRALEGQQIAVTGNIDPGLSGNFTTNSRRLLDTDNDDLPKKLEEYAKKILTTFIQREPSQFMKITLDTAWQRSTENEALTRALELWVIVHILVDDNVPWVISERIDEQAATGAGPIIDKNAGDNTYEDLYGQLNAAAEKKAAQMCKDVLNDFEKRLLQRANTSAFDFFLTAIIILNCIEKSTWLFKSWDQESFKGRWPLDKKPEYFALQGDRLANTINMLLNVRSSPPKTFIRPDGILATDGDSATVNYFNQVKLEYNEVLHQSVNNDFDPGNCRCFELKLCARLLLPAQV